MSRYLLLFILNLPLIMAGIVNATVGYKLKKLSKKRYTFYVVFWLVIAGGLALAGPFYDYLYDHNLTETDSLSLFDVIQITAIILLLYITTRMLSKINAMENRMQDLHQEVSIRLSSSNKDR